MWAWIMFKLCPSWFQPFTMPRTHLPLIRYFNFPLFWCCLICFPFSYFSFFICHTNWSAFDAYFFKLCCKCLFDWVVLLFWEIWINQLYDLIFPLKLLIWPSPYAQLLEASEISLRFGNDRIKAVIGCSQTHSEFESLGRWIVIYATLQLGPFGYHGFVEFSNHIRWNTVLLTLQP